MSKPTNTPAPAPTEESVTAILNGAVTETPIPNPTDRPTVYRNGAKVED